MIIYLAWFFVSCGELRPCTFCCRLGKRGGQERLTDLRSSIRYIVEMSFVEFRFDGVGDEAWFSGAHNDDCA